MDSKKAIIYIGFGVLLYLIAEAVGGVMSLLTSNIAVYLTSDPITFSVSYNLIKLVTFLGVYMYGIVRFCSIDFNNMLVNKRLFKQSFWIMVGALFLCGVVNVLIYMIFPKDQPERMSEMYKSLEYGKVIKSTIDFVNYVIQIGIVLLLSYRMIHRQAQ